MTDEFRRAIVSLDRKLAATGEAVWTDSEPTFTDRRLETAEWLYEALGEDKEARAREMLASLLAHRPGALVLRTVGRQYSGEPVPRWSYGLYQRRDGGALWSGPADPLAGGLGCSAKIFQAFSERLPAQLRIRTWRAAGVKLTAEGTAPEARLVVRLDGSEPVSDPTVEPRLARDSVHAQPIPGAGPRDELAEQGNLLLVLRHRGPDQAAMPAVAELELPAWPNVASFRELLEALARTAAETRLPGLMLTGFPPPVDESVVWTTLTPDPAVLEVNQAPARTLVELLDCTRELYTAAGQAGLCPYRLHYNGAQSDSGGGGQITLGGPSPLESPFLRHPRLLPRLVRYFTRHPSLSYWFGPDFLGGSSQAPRVDEGVRDNFRELGLTLELMERAAGLEPERLWAFLSPFLCDPSGNPHRSELNIEKLWNPYLAGRGRLGLVEFRALRMAPTPEQATAVAALLRALAVLLVRHDPVPQLEDWGDELHERFALPYYLRRDLDEVLTDLAGGGMGLAGPVRARLLDAGTRHIGQVEMGGWRIELTSALEFWPLVGDVASQEAGGSRTTDSSSGRIQLLLRPLEEGCVDPERWILGCNGYRLRLRPDRDAEGPLRLLGIRYRRFAPLRGLHPGIGAHDPLEILLFHPRLPQGLSLHIHEWRPQGQPYPGLPADLQEAQCRRRERFVYRFTAAAAPLGDAPPSAHGPYTFDLRRTAPS